MRLPSTEIWLVGDLATGAVDAEPTDLAKTITRMMGGGGS